MKCPFCSHLDDRVIDSRSSGEGEVVRRRRECQKCERRYTTYERVEEAPRLVRKKGGRREPFNRQKILQGLLKACEKRPVQFERLEALVGLVEQRINEEFDYEVESRFIGEILVDELKKIDQVAYVRFASVYREFADVTEFIRELTPLIGKPMESQKAGDQTAVTLDSAPIPGAPDSGLPDSRSPESVPGRSRLPMESDVGRDRLRLDAGGDRDQTRSDSR